MKVALFVTCLVDQLFPDIGLSVVRILNRLGVEVEFNPQQTCCGQPALNTGYPAEARQVARHFLSTFGEAGLIVIPSGSCAAMVKVYLPGLFEKGSAERRRADDIAARTWEFSDFLTSVLEVEETGASFSGRVTYHESCHLLRELKVSEAPKRLIRSVNGIDFREMPDADQCCGFGGTFSVKFPELSTAIAQAKIRSILEVGADYVIANDISCLMHLDGLLKRAGQPAQIMHIAQLLAHFPGRGP